MQLCKKMKSGCIHNGSKCQEYVDKSKSARQIDFWQKVFFFLHDSPCILGFVCSYYRQQIIVHQKVTYCWVTEKKKRHIHTHRQGSHYVAGDWSVLLEEEKISSWAQAFLSQLCSGSPSPWLL